MANFANTIIAKSDQLNADDLLSGPITIKITQVSYNESKDQPCVIRYEGDKGRPYKPNKTMRRLIIHAWTDEGDNWVGKFMTLWRDPTVKWAGEEVGGLSIQAMSDIDADFDLALQVTRGVKKKFSVKKMKANQKKADAAPPAAHNPAAPENKEPETQQGGTQGKPNAEGDFHILPAEGEPLRFPTAEALHEYLVRNFGKFKTKATLGAFIKRNEGNFDRYTVADQTGFMQKSWDMLNKKMKEFDDAAEPNL